MAELKQRNILTMILQADTFPVLLTMPGQNYGFSPSNASLKSLAGPGQQELKGIQSGRLQRNSRGKESLSTRTTTILSEARYRET